MHTPPYICDAVRTPFARKGGALSGLSAAELAAVPLIALAVRNAHLDWEQVDDVVYGCAQLDTAERNVGHVAAKLAGLPGTVPGVTINRLCGSGLDAIGSAARAIKAAEAMLVIAGGVEASQLAHTHHDSTTGANLARLRATGSLRQDAPVAAHEMNGKAAVEALAQSLGVDRQSQDRYAAAAIARARTAQRAGYFVAEITAATTAPTDGESVVFVEDDCAPFFSEQKLAAEAPFPGSALLTAGTSAHAANGSCAMLLASEKMAHKYSLLPRARVLGMAVAGVPDKATGIGPANAARKVLVQVGLSMAQMDVIELHDVYAAQTLAVLRDWTLQDDDPRVNPNGGALTLGNPCGASGARLVLAAIAQLHRVKGRYALCVTCVGASQGVAMIVERV